MTVSLPSVFVIPRSACGVGLSESVAELLVRLGSTMVLGAVTVAVLTRVPARFGLTEPLTVYVMVLPTGMFTVSEILPLPLAVKPVAPPVATAE